MSKTIVAVDVCNLNLSSMLQYHLIINELQEAGDNVSVYIGPTEIPKGKTDDTHDLINFYKNIFKSIVPDVITFNDLHEDMNVFLRFASNLTRISVDAMTPLVKTKGTLYASDLLVPVRFVTDVDTLKPDLLVATEGISRIYDLIDDSKKCLRQVITEVPTFKTSLSIQDDDKTISSKVNKTFCNDEIDNSIYLQTRKLIIPYLSHILIDGAVYGRDNFEREFAGINKKSLKTFIAKFFASYRDRLLHC